MTQKAIALAASALVVAGGLLGWGVARSGPGEASALAAELSRLKELGADQATQLNRLEKQASAMASLRKEADDRASRIAALEVTAAAPREGSGVRAAIGDLSARLSRTEEAVRDLEKAAAPVDPARRRKEVLETLKAIADGKRQVALRDAVEDLVRMGDPAVPDIVEILDSGFDRQYYGKPTMISGGIPDAINYGGLRQVLMDALRQMATPLAKEKLFQVVDRSKRLADLRDLLVPYVMSADPVVVKGIAALVSDMLQRIGEADPGDEVAYDLGRWLARWLAEHGRECSAAQLEQAVGTARYGPDGWPRWAPDLFRLLVKAEPERAARVVVALREKSPGLAADRQAMLAFTMGPGNWTVPLARWAEYYRALLPSLTPADAVRTNLFTSMPSVCCSTIQDPSARAEDARVFLAFLDECLGAESNDTIRYSIESHIKMLRSSIARDGR